MSLQSFKNTPEYVKHNSDEDVVNVLACQIKVWTPNGHNWFDVPSVTSDLCTTLTEVESIDINNSIKEIISTATVRIPRGTVISKITKYEKEVSTGNHTNQKSERRLDEATEDGQLLTKDAYVNVNGEGVLPIRAIRSEDVDYGTIIVTRKSTDRVATDKDFSVGSRIQIKLGYVKDLYDDRGNVVQTATDRLEAIRFMDDADELKLVFTGFITSCSASSPLEIGCENMASMFKKINCPNIVAKGDLTVNDFLKSGGRFDLLKDTGISLSSVSEEVNINIGKVSIDSNVTVADVFAEWNKSGVLALMEPDGRHVRVGFASNVGSASNSDKKESKKYLSYNDNNKRFIVQFDWDVADDDLKIVHVDKKYLAVRAVGNISDKKFTLTIRPRLDIDAFEEIDEDDDTEFNVVNEREPRPKLGRLKKDGTRAKLKKPGIVVRTKQESKVKLDNYTIVPYISAKKNITREQLLEEAKNYWKSYSQNGISGSLTLFGDVDINISDVIGLIDPSRPEVNGYYFVESLDIDFGINGYRKKIKIPNKIMNFSQKIKIIR